MSGNDKKVVSIKTLAVYLNMSHATVSRALNDKSVISDATKEKVREAAKKFGYVANSGARLVRGMRGRLVGLIIPDVQNDFYSMVAKILAQSCANEGLELILAVSDDDSALEARHIRSMLEARVAGIIITPTIGLKLQEADFLARVPCVQIVRRHELIRASHVRIDDSQGINLATKHLLDLGHRRIGFIGGSRQLSTSVDRLSGYQEALAEYKIKIKKKFILLGPPRPEFGCTAMKTLQSLEQKPTAFVVGSSQLTLGALQALNQLKISIPDHVSLVGYGNPLWFELALPPITTVDLPVEALAKGAAADMFNQLKEQDGKSKKLDETIVFLPRLCVRKSTKRQDVI